MSRKNSIAKSTRLRIDSTHFQVKSLFQAGWLCLILLPPIAHELSIFSNISFYSAVFTLSMLASLNKIIYPSFIFIPLISRFLISDQKLSFYISKALIPSQRYLILQFSLFLLPVKLKLIQITSKKPYFSVLMVSS